MSSCKRILYAMVVALVGMIMSACHDIPEYADNPRGNFEALWSIIDEHYCFFSEKDIDWDEVHGRYSARIADNMSRDELFNLLSEMVNELRDGHVNLSSPWSTSYYRKWWSDYPQNYNARLIEQYYFNFNYRSLGTVNYGLLQDNIGYMHYGSFETGLGAGNIDYILQYFNTARALIIDVRDNGGGALTHVGDLVNRFIESRTLAGYIIHKTGPGHDDFSEPFAYYYDPAGGHLRWTKPVVVLANRSTFSAANNFVSIMKLLPGVTVIGDTTGGGSGMPYSSEIPNGWGIRFSACSILDAEGHTTEQGVEPSEGCEVDMTVADEITGHDTILDFAINYINSRY